MYEHILVPIDNSLHSRAAARAAITIGSRLGSTLVGMNVYAARLHRGRFRQLEAFLPPRFQDASTLQRQRGIHGGLIRDGLRLIADSYLDWFEEECWEREVSCQRKLAEGRNYVEILRELGRNGYGLVALGALGLGAVPESLIGSVCERVLRRSPVDVLVAREGASPQGGRIVVGIDGSVASYHALEQALALGRALDIPVEAVAVYDPDYHRVAFRGITQVLSAEAAQRFRFQEQEQLHNEIIDRGLAQVYGRHLERARAQAIRLGVELETTTLLTGKPFVELLRYVTERPTFALVVGRTGAHRDRYGGGGSVVENLARLAPCNLLAVGAPRDGAVKTHLAT
ncbi:MAG: universal stress protein [Chloroflexi bacterium]|nr:universal stress protein [Chloroflexota bacterium]